MLRHLLNADPAFTCSVAEERFLALVRKAELPRPEVNEHVGGARVDFLWRSQRCIVEIDGFAYHGDRAAFERDRRRDARLIADGMTVMRVTWRQLRDEPIAVVARVARALGCAQR